MSAAADQSRKRGACPSLSRPMRTGDGLLVRLQPDSGKLSPAQLRSLAQAARLHGNGLLEITARGNLQIRGLTDASVRRLADAVNELGIEPRTGIPVEANALAGLDNEEIADPRPLVRAIRAAAAASGMAARLGPKVTVVIDGGGRFGLGGLLADIRLEAVRVSSGVEWLVSIAGTAATATPLSQAMAREAATSVLDLLSAVAARGREARARDLIGTAAPIASALSSSPQGRSERPVIGICALAGSSCALVTAFAFGQAEAHQVEAFSDAAERAGALELRFASERRLVTMLSSPRASGALRQAAAECGFVVSPGDPRLSIVACAGAPSCTSAFLDTKRLAGELASAHGEGFHVSGCSKRCAEPTGRLPALIGVSTGMAELVTASGTRRVATGQALAAIRRLHTNPDEGDIAANQNTRRPLCVPAVP